MAEEARHIRGQRIGQPRIGEPRIGQPRIGLAERRDQGRRSAIDRSRGRYSERRLGLGRRARRLDPGARSGQGVARAVELPLQIGIGANGMLGRDAFGNGEALLIDIADRPVDRGAQREDRDTGADRDRP